MVGRSSVERLMAFLFWQSDDGESGDADTRAPKRYFSGVMMTMMVAGSRAQMVALSLVHRHRKESPPAP